MAISVTLTFNCASKITLTSTSEQDKTLLGLALNNRVVKAVNPVADGFEIVLVEKAEER